MKRRGFTLAEVLITLAIIGVIAGITIPSVIINHQKKEYATRLKKTFSGLNKGFRLAMAKDGVTSVDNTVMWSKMQGSNVGYRRMKDNEEFFKEFKRYFNVISIYDGETTKLNGTGIKYKELNSRMNWGTYEYGIVLGDGTILYPNFTKNVYSDVMVDGSRVSSLSEIRAKAPDIPLTLIQRAGSVAIDVNGVKGPNTVGRDFFLCTIGNDGTIYPNGSYQTALNSLVIVEYDEDNGWPIYWIYTDARYVYEDYLADPGYIEDCDTKRTTGGSGCAGRIAREGWQMKY